MIKTRKELEQELEGTEIKNGIQQEKDDLKALLDTFLSDLRNTKPAVTHKYELSDEVALKELKTALESVNIPEEVKLVRENKIVFDNKTSKWLVWWGWISYVLFFAFTVWIVTLYKTRVSESDYKALEKKHRYDNYMLERMKEKAPNSYKAVLEDLKKQD